MKVIAIVMRNECLDDQYKWFLNETYVKALQSYDVALFPLCCYASLQRAVSCCDGLISPGGYDLHGFYVQEVQSASATCYTHPMDYFDFACIDAFVQANKPILGICRGMQLLNVYFGGSLYQDIDTSIHESQHMHTITFCEHSFLHQLYASNIQVNSFHHQCVRTLGNELIASAYSNDAHIEAFIHVSKKIIAVQWHPEKMEDDQILPYFLSLL